MFRKPILFLREGFGKGTQVRSYESFLAFAQQNLSRDKRGDLTGQPFSKRTYTVKIFQNPLLMILNPFWIEYWGQGGRFDLAPQGRGASAQLRRLTEKSGNLVDSVTSKRVRTSSRSKDNFPKTPWLKTGRYPIDERVGRGSSRLANNVVENNRFVHDVFIFQHTKNSVKTPNFRTIKKKDLPWNNYSQIVTRANEEPGVIGDTTWAEFRDYGHIRGLYGNNCHGVMDFATTPDLGTADAALGKAKLNAKHMSINIAQAYGERKQTVGLITTSLNRLLNLVIALKKGDVKRAKLLVSTYAGGRKVAVMNREGTKVLKYIRSAQKLKGQTKKSRPENLANLWLEFQYGWKPLLSDIYGACETIADTYYRAKPSTISGTSKADHAPKDKVITGGSYGSLAYNEVLKVKRDAVSKVVFQVREDDDAIRTLSKHGLTNPALLAWELLPYSFVVDWILPVGKYLDQLDALVGMNFIKGSTSTTATVEVSSNLVRTAGGGLAALSGSTVTVNRRAKGRSIYYSVPLTQLPAFKPKLGVERSLSAISLLIQKFASGKTSAR